MCRSRILVLLVVSIFSLCGWHWASSADAPAAAPPAAPIKFQFDVVESFDSRYPGDTPGHLGRSGDPEARRPNIALDDPVFRGEERIGHVTGISWDRGKNSLTIELTSDPGVRIAVGDSVWTWLDGRQAKSDAPAK